MVRLFTVNLISYFQPSGGATLPFRRLLLQWELGLWIASPAANQIEFVVAHFRFSAALPPSITCRVVILIAESHWYAKTELSVLTGLLWLACGQYIIKKFHRKRDVGRTGIVRKWNVGQICFCGRRNNIKVNEEDPRHMLEQAEGENLNL